MGLHEGFVFEGFVSGEGGRCHDWLGLTRFCSTVTFAVHILLTHLMLRIFQDHCCLMTGASRCMKIHWLLGPLPADPIFVMASGARVHKSTKVDEETFGWLFVFATSQDLIDTRSEIQHSDIVRSSATCCKIFSGLVGPHAFSVRCYLIRLSINHACRPSWS